MDSDESGHSESEFYYPEEETVNQITPINRDDVKQERHLNNIQDFIYSLRPDNTKKKTTYDLNIWQRYCSTVGEARALENIPFEELNILLCRFFMDVGIKRCKGSTSQARLHLFNEVFNVTCTTATPALML